MAEWNNVLRPVLRDARNAISRPQGWIKSVWGSWEGDEGYPIEADCVADCYMIPAEASVCLDGGLLRALAQYLPEVVTQGEMQIPVGIHNGQTRYETRKMKWLDETHPSAVMLRKIVVRAINEVFPDHEYGPFEDIPNFNDYDLTTQADVVKVLARAEQILEEEATEADLIKEVQILIAEADELLKKGDNGGAAAKEYQAEQKIGMKINAIRMMVKA